MAGLTGVFTSIPSGTLNATITGGRLQAPFLMKAQFTAEGSGSCAPGEYRQYVRGEFLANGKVVPHVLCGSVYLSKTEFREDGCPPPGCTAYGYRACNSTKSKYTPTQSTGCSFAGEDEPGISAAPGTKVEMNLDFEAYLVDTRDNSILAKATWSVRGSGTMPTTLVARSIETGTQDEKIAALCTLDEDAGAWEVYVIIPRKTGQGPILGSDVEIAVTDSRNEVLALLERPNPTEQLVEVGGARHVTASGVFKLKAGGPPPKQLEIRLGEQWHSFVLEPKE